MIALTKKLVWNRGHDRQPARRAARTADPRWLRGRARPCRRGRQVDARGASQPHGRAEAVLRLTAADPCCVAEDVDRAAARARAARPPHADDSRRGASASRVRVDGARPEPSTDHRLDRKVGPEPSPGEAIGLAGAARPSHRRRGRAARGRGLLLPGHRSHTGFVHDRTERVGCHRRRARRRCGCVALARWDEQALLEAVDDLLPLGAADEVEELGDPGPLVAARVDEVERTPKLVRAIT